MEFTFQNLELSKPILSALNDEGYVEPTPIQREAIPVVLAGRDLLASAQTGTGKTAAFALPILEKLCVNTDRKAGPPRALVLTPTRELALQIDENFRAYGRHLRIRTSVILGGVSPVPQIKALKRNPDVVIATPGRLLDLMGQGYVDLKQIEVLVLDEADRMLDMGFVRDVRKIVSHAPKSRQTLLFSATLDAEVGRLASDLLKNPERIEIARAATVAMNIEQKVFFVDQADKRALLQSILSGSTVSRALVFTRTKHRANQLARQLSKGGISADAIHSNKSQGARQKALAEFDRGRTRVLVGTDIVARGIDVDGISHVINFELPEDPENYVHRIGRTARAGANGIAISLCAIHELESLNGIEKLTKVRLDRSDDHPFHSDSVATLHNNRVERQRPRQRGNGNGYGRRSKPAGGRRRNGR